LDDIAAAVAMAACRIGIPAMHARSTRRLSSSNV